MTLDDALAHPTWAMGPVVTLNSSTLVNKGLELIEAHLLFGVPYERIDVVVHPQSMVHSMVEFTDGSTIAQASPPDMRLPIALGLGWPDRVPGAAPAVDWTQRRRPGTFEPLDDDGVPGGRPGARGGCRGGCLPAVYNAANEEGVDAFLAGSAALRRGSWTRWPRCSPSDASVAGPATGRRARRRGRPDSGRAAGGGPRLTRDAAGAQHARHDGPDRDAS